jgi:hypothetical protein
VRQFLEFVEGKDLVGQFINVDGVLFLAESMGGDPEKLVRSSL